MRNDDQTVINFIYHCMTQAEQALDGQDPGRMAEALRSILQGAYEVHDRQRRAVEPALPRPTVAARPGPSAA